MKLCPIEKWLALIVLFVGIGSVFKQQFEDAGVVLDHCCNERAAATRVTLFDVGPGPDKGMDKFEAKIGIIGVENRLIQCAFTEFITGVWVIPALQAGDEYGEVALSDCLMDVVHDGDSAPHRAYKAT